MTDKIRYKALSLFSGAGGMDIGVEAAGFDILAELEIDEHCCNTLHTAQERQNTGTQILEGDIREIDTSVLRKQLGLRKKELDFLFGGPPCQSFSVAGKQLGLNDSRGMLLFEIIRFAEEFQPKVILLEQVKGLLSSKGPLQKRGEVFETFLSKLEEAGYTPKWRTIIAADFGVPQRRERLFVIATRGKNGFVFPERTHAPLEECDGLFSFKTYVTVGEVIDGIGGCPRIEIYQFQPHYVVSTSLTNHNILWSELSKPSSRTAS